MRDAFDAVAHLQPRVSVNDHVVIEQPAAKLEVATVSRETTVERDFEHQWLGSTKRMRVRGDYVVRAGFDLKKPVEVHVQGRKVVAELPPPVVLSVDQLSLEVLDVKDGLWNKITPADVVDEVRTLPETAKQKAAQSGIQFEAVEAFRSELQEKLGPGYQLEFEITPEISSHPE